MTIPKLKILLKNGAELKKSHEGDAGLDIKTIDNGTIVGIQEGGTEYKGEITEGKLFSRIDYIEYKTGIYLDPSELESFILAYPRSSNSKMNLILANSVGVIDTGYTGEILIRFKYIIQPEDMVVLNHSNICNLPIMAKINKNLIYSKGDKIAQLIPAKHIPYEIEYVEELKKTTRQDGSFGSTGK